MKIYSYSPPRGDSVSKTLAFCILGGALVVVMLAEFLPEAAPILQTGGFVLAMAGLLVCTRFLLSGYTYNLESAADGTSPDLVIVENKGKVNRTVCRVSVAGGKLCRFNKKTKLASGKVYDYRPTPFGNDSWVFEVPERDGEGFVLFSPDDKLLALMQSAGCALSE